MNSRAPTDDFERTETAREALARVLADMFAERNYTSSYLARRCRTTEEDVAAWVTGAQVPSGGEWGFLCSVSRDFMGQTNLWDDARAEMRTTPRSNSTTLVEEAAPTTRADAGRDEPAGGEEQGRPVDELVAVDLASPANSTDGPPRLVELRANHQGSGEDADEVEASSSPTRRGAKTTRISVPSDFVVYACKIGKGRLVKIPLPLRLTRADVERLHTFLLTQVDDDGEKP